MYNAFFNRDLEEEVYMDLSPGLIIQGEHSPSSRIDCKLQKSLYGLKQASRQWNSKFAAFVLAYGFRQFNLIILF